MATASPLLCVIAPSSLPNPAPTRQFVTLIRPSYVIGDGTFSVPIGVPMGVAYLAAVVREAGHEVRVIDALGESPDQITSAEGFHSQGLTIEQTVDRIDPRSTVIGVSCMFTQDWPWSRGLIRAIRARFPRALLLAGGEHITAEPEFSLRDCEAIDLCALGEGEETLVELLSTGLDPARRSFVAGLAYLDENGQFVKTSPRQRIRAVDSIPRPAWDLCPTEYYLTRSNTFGVNRGRSMGILATRGCPYKCTFCSNPGMYGKSYFTRDPDDVLDEIQSYIDTYRAESFDFYDLTMVLRKEWVLKFCRRIEERGMKFLWQLPTGTRSEVIDDEVAAALYRTGCRNVAYAPESGSEETLRIIKKQVHLDRLVSSIRSALRNRLVVRVNLIIGFPHETRRHVLKTVFFAWKLAWNGAHAVLFFVFSPYPGTQLYHELRADGTIPELDDDYFRSLAGYKDPRVKRGYCKRIGPREIQCWRIFGMASFFLLWFLLRPLRIVRSISNIVSRRVETDLEDRLAAKFHRGLSWLRKTRRPAKPVPSSASV